MQAVEVTLFVQWLNSSGLIRHTLKLGEDEHNRNKNDPLSVNHILKAAQSTPRRREAFVSTWLI